MTKNPPAYFILTLGCPKNQVDSEAMATLLMQQGYRAVANPDEADVLIVNTCGFLQASQKESLDVLQGLSEGKRKQQVLVAAGCMAERDSQKIVDAVPGVDALLGTLRWPEITDLASRLRGGKRRRTLQRIALLGEPEASMNAMPTPRPPQQFASAYLKISDGCNASCAFCTIPSFKGKLRSHDFEAILAEADNLVRAGARELVVVGQDSTDYGRDLGDPNALPRLLHAIARRTPGLQWLRLMYAYPGHVSDALIQVMAETPQILPYLDIPLQHGHPDTLRRMRRPGNVDRILKTVTKLRAAMPDIALRSTFIVGYPGETEEEFAALLRFIEEIAFDKVGVFKFSAEPGTPAAQLPDQIPEAVKEERWHQVMALQQAISLRRNQAQVGRVLTVLTERHEEGMTLARSYRDAPEVDGYVILEGVYPLGRMVQARITGAMEYDLAGEIASHAAALD
ncbi:MAG: 30S ribosomal protein S12 methylthiotransferase RimO [Clostridia bacterium]|nr:MAG: 30S ribosomal protein S12 methylthiotransferase RimO [Clostridia bacterium]